MGEASLSGSGLETFVIPDKVSTIPVKLFQNCASLKTVTIPDTVSSIGSYAFSNCDSLKEIAIPKLTRALPTYLFEGCSSLETINFHEDITSIGQCAFKDCIGLKSVTLPGLISTISDGLFNGCRLLESVTIPSTVSKIQHYSGNGRIFYGCISLKELLVYPEVPPTSSGSTAGYDYFLADVHPSLQIKVPAASLEAYKSAELWKPFASKIVAIPENE